MWGCSNPRFPHYLFLLMALTKSDLASNQQVAVSGLQLDSFASDKISEVAGLKDLNANLDGEATIQAASTAKSTAVSTGVTDKVASLAEIGSNAGLTTHEFSQLAPLVKLMGVVSIQFQALHPLPREMLSL